jgi:glycosyltransferase 2 family protein
VDRVLDAIGVFFSQLASVDLGALALAVCCHLVKLACTSRAWRNVIAAAYPAERVRWRSIHAAYLSGVGVNAIVPARGGDVLRVYLAHRAVPGSTYTTLGSTFLVMAIVDSSLALVFFGYALTLGVLPGVNVLPHLPSFDFAWLFENGRTTLGIVFVLVVVGLAATLWLETHVREFHARIRQAFSVISPPRRYLRTVVFWQLCDWALRLASIWFFLDAFGLEQSVRNVLLVQVTQSLATLVPVSPGGIGTEQAFLFYVFRGQAPRSSLLAFSVGMKVTLTIVNVAVGFLAILLTLRTLRFRRVLDADPLARAQVSKE